MTRDREEEFAAVEHAYRRARWTLIGHGVFLAACIGLAVLFRRLMKLPPAVLGTVFIVALIVFGADIMKFLRLRDRRRQLGSD